MHATYINGHVFSTSPEMAIALHDFESAIDAAIKGDTGLYKPQQPKPAQSKKILMLVSSVAATLGIFFLRKKLS